MCPVLHGTRFSLSARQSRSPRVRGHTPQQWVALFNTIQCFLPQHANFLSPPISYIPPRSGTGRGLAQVRFLRTPTHAREKGGEVGYYEHVGQKTLGHRRTTHQVGTHKGGGTGLKSSSANQRSSKTGLASCPFSSSLGYFAPFGAPHSNRRQLRSRGVATGAHHSRNGTSNPQQWAV